MACSARDGTLVQWTPQGGHRLEWSRVISFRAGAVAPQELPILIPGAIGPPILRVTTGRI